MSNPPGPRNGVVSTTTLMVCITTLTCFVGALALVAFLFSPESRDPTVLVATLVSVLAPTIAALVTLTRVGNVSEQVSDVAEDTHKLANGLGDSKIRAAVAEVLPDHLIDPAAKSQLELDKLQRLLPEEHK